MTKCGIEFFSVSYSFRNSVGHGIVKELKPGEARGALDDLTDYFDLRRGHTYTALLWKSLGWALGNDDANENDFKLVASPLTVSLDPKTGANTIAP